jgi:hypothetical protein
MTLRGYLTRVGHLALSAMVATALLVGMSVALTSTVASALTAATHAVAASSLTTNGQWAGVGKICESGPGGASSVRGVKPKTINIAVFNDAANTIEPGLEEEFVQFANAFATWCNASGGIYGRHVVIDNRDAAFFNAGQAATASCQSDFMAVGGGLVFDNQSTPVRVACGLGSITGYTVSDASAASTLQVNPSNINPKYVSAGWFAALAKKYPKAVKEAAMSTGNNANDLEPEHKWEDSAEAAGWKIQEFQTTPISVVDWTPYVQDFSTKGFQAVWPDPLNITPYLRAMSTAGYDPTFLALSNQFYAQSTIKSLAGLHDLPPIYVPTDWWPLEMASQNPATEQLVQLMHTYAKGDTIDFDDEEAAESWLLWAKSASACGVNLTVSCVLKNAATQKNWSAGGIEAPVAQLTMSNENPVPGPCFAVLEATPKGFVYAKSITQPTQSIWNCNPKNVIKLTPQQLAAIG